MGDVAEFTGMLSISVPIGRQQSGVTLNFPNEKSALLRCGLSSKFSGHFS